MCFYDMFMLLKLEFRHCCHAFRNLNGLFQFIVYVAKISLNKYVNTPGLKCCGTGSIFICASIICFKAFVFTYFTELVCPI
jgi:hypothetical protein